MTAKWGGWQIRNVDETEQQAFRNGRGKSELARGSGNISEREAGRSSGAKAFERERECVCVCAATTTILPEFFGDPGVGN